MNCNPTSGKKILFGSVKQFNSWEKPDYPQHASFAVAYYRPLLSEDRLEWQVPPQLWERSDAVGAIQAIFLDGFIFTKGVEKEKIFISNGQKPAAKQGGSSFIPCR